MKNYLIFLLCLFCLTTYSQAPVEEFDKNGVLRSTGKYKNNLKDGVWKFYDQNGNIESSGNYSNNKSNGVWNYYHANSTVSATGNFSDGSKQGVWKLFDENGKLIESGNYKNDLKEGVWNGYSPEGNITASGKFDKDKKIGEWQTYYPNGQVNEVAKFTNGLLNGDYKQYYENGKVSVVGKYVDNLKLGPWTYYYSNGQASEKGTYEHADNYTYDDYGYEYTDKVESKTDMWNSYYENGQLRSTGYYDKNEKTGPWQYFGPKGNIALKGSFKNDERIGEWMAYYDNGKPLLKGKYQQDAVTNAYDENRIYAKSIGTWVAYWEDGSEAKHYDFSDNETYIEKVISTRYNDKYVYPDGGFGKGETVMSLGVSVNTVTGKNVIDFEQALNKFGSFYRYGKWEEYTKEGWKYAEGNYNWKTNKQDEMWTFYSQSGTITATKTYKDGVLEGTTTYFRENGKKSSELVMSKGNITAVTGWDENGIISEKSTGDGTGKVQRVYYYPNGKISSYGTDTWNSKEKKYLRNGSWTFNFENGIKRFVEIYKDGVLQKIWEQVLPNGDKVLINGNGKHKTFYDNGQLSFEAELKNGARNGIANWYYDNGQLEKSVLYQYDEKSTPIGKRMEILASFSKNGTPRDKGTLKNGNGTWINYNTSDEISEIDTYKDGYKTQ